MTESPVDFERGANHESDTHIAYNNITEGQGEGKGHADHDICIRHMG